MLLISPDECSASTIRKLNSLQEDIDELNSVAEKREKVKLYWKLRRKNKAFREINAKLLDTYPGGFCCYCETSEITDLEHIYPKEHFPGRAFHWDNYVLSCAKCNSHNKGAKWAVFKDSNSLDYWNEIDWDETPPEGDSLFVDIRKENPQFLIRLDFETFTFEPNTRDSRQKVRVDYTINIILKLNDGSLPLARRQAFFSFVKQLEEMQAMGMSERVEKRRFFLKATQRTVWKEMQRWHLHPNLPRLRELFEAVPEALDF